MWTFSCEWYSGGVSISKANVSGLDSTDEGQFMYFLLGSEGPLKR